MVLRLSLLINVAFLPFIIVIISTFVSNTQASPSHSRNLRASGSLFPLIGETVREPKRSRQTREF